MKIARIVLLPIEAHDGLARSDGAGDISMGDVAQVRRDDDNRPAGRKGPRPAPHDALDLVDGKVLDDVLRMELANFPRASGRRTTSPAISTSATMRRSRWMCPGWAFARADFQRTPFPAMAVGRPGRRRSIDSIATSTVKRSIQTGLSHPEGEQGKQSRPRTSIAGSTSGPMGDHCFGSDGPQRTSVRRPSWPDRCAGPELLPMKRSARSRRSDRTRVLSRPAAE